MKKFLKILTISLLCSNISLAKISEEYYEVLYEGCMETAKKKKEAQVSQSDTVFVLRITLINVLTTIL